MRTQFKFFRNIYNKKVGYKNIYAFPKISPKIHVYKNAASEKTLQVRYKDR